MKIRNCFIIILILTTHFNLIKVNANDAVDTLTAIGAVSNDVTNKTQEEFITRAEFSFMVSKLTGITVLNPTKTRFSDVNAQNKYSGYIEYLANMGIVGYEENQYFKPDDKVDLTMADKILLKVLSCEEIAIHSGGYPAGYNKLAVQLGLHKHLSLKGEYLTRNDAVTMVYNALIAEVPQIYIHKTDNEFSYTANNNSNKMILCDKLKISVYYGTILGFNYNNQSVKFMVEKNKYERNHVPLSNGTLVNFSSDENIDKYENVPVIIWVNNDDEIINVQLQKNIKLVYGSIDSINGDRDKESRYAIKYIDRLSIVDDETKYTVRQGVQLIYNETATSSPVKLIDRFAKMVVKNNEVIYIESWDLVLGGIIDFVSSDTIDYTQSDVQENKKIRDLNQYKIKRIFINNDAKNVDDLREDSLFYYYKNDDTIVIVATEITVTGKLNSLSTNTIEIGEQIYNYKEVMLQYDSCYQVIDNINELLGENVTGYIAFDGKIACLNKVLNSKNEFYGIVDRYETDSLENKTKIRLWVTEPSLQKVIYEITKHTVYNDGLSFNEITKYSEDLSGKGIFLFSANDTGKITSVRRPTPFYGFGDKVESVIGNTFMNYSFGYANINNKVLYFDENQNITAIYMKNGQFTVGQTTWKRITNKSGIGSKLVFYGERLQSIPSFILLCKDTGDLSYVGGTEKFGVVLKKNDALDKNGYVCKKVSILTTDGVKDYNISKKEAEDLSIYELINLYDGTIFSDFEMIPGTSTSVDLTDDFENWPVEDSANAKGFHKGIVEKNDGLRIYLKDGSDYFKNKIYPVTYMMYDQSLRDIFKEAKSSDIDVGDEVYYYLTDTSRVTFILVIK